MTRIPMQDDPLASDLRALASKAREASTNSSIDIKDIRELLRKIDHLLRRIPKPWEDRLDRHARRGWVESLRHMVEYRWATSAMSRLRNMAEYKWATLAMSRLAVIVESSNDAIMSKALDGTIETWNPAAERLFGYTAEEVVGRPISLLIPPDRSEEFPRIMERISGGKRVEPFETVRVRKDGRRFDVSVSISPIKNADGNIVGASIIAREITERKRAERRRAAQHATTRVLAESETLVEAAPRILRAICEALGWDLGTLWMLDSNAHVLRCLELWHEGSANYPEFEKSSREHIFKPEIGLPGRVWASGQSAWVEDVTRDPNFPRATVAAREGLHGSFGFPIVLGGRVLGVLEFFSRAIEEPDVDLLTMVETIGSQIGQFIERTRAETERDRLFTLSRDMFCSADFDGYFKLLNPAWERILGFPQEELKTKPYLDFVHPDDREETADKTRELMSGINVVQFENRYRCMDGSYRWILWNAVPLPRERMIYAVAHDFTGRKRAEEALTKERNQLRTLIDNLPDCIFFKDVESRFIINNAAHLRILKAKTQEEVLNTTDKQWFPRELAERYLDDERDIIASGQPLLNREEPIIDETGIRRWLSTTKVPLRDERGTIIGLVGISRDITMRKRAEEALHDDTHLLKPLDIVLSRLSALGSVVPQKVADQLNDLSRMAHTIVRLAEGSTRTMLNFMVGRTWDKPKRCNEVVRNWFADVPGFIFDSMIDVRTNDQLGDEPFWANLDEVLASLLNLQTNAVNALYDRGRGDRRSRRRPVEASPARGGGAQGRPYQIIFSAEIGTLEETTEINATGAEYVVLSVADSGNGIPSHTQNQLFRGRITESAGGYGLGSQSIRRVMDNHRGLIRFSSREGVGTLVELWFPRLVDPGDPDNKSLHEQWKPYEALREAVDPVRSIGEGALLAALIGAHHPS